MRCGEKRVIPSLASCPSLAVRSKRACCGPTKRGILRVWRACVRMGFRKHGYCTVERALRRSKSRKAGPATSETVPLPRLALPFSLPSAAITVCLPCRLAAILVSNALAFVGGAKLHACSCLHASRRSLFIAHTAALLLKHTSPDVLFRSTGDTR